MMKLKKKINSKINHQRKYMGQPGFPQLTCDLHRWIMIKKIKLFKKNLEKGLKLYQLKKGKKKSGKPGLAR